MKLPVSLLCIPCLVLTLHTGAQTTAIPDPNFEQALIDLGFDSGKPDGVALNIFLESIIELNVPERNISDLTGIESCVSLERLYCQQNNLTSLDLSNNPYLWRLFCNDNMIENLDLSNHVYLENLNCHNNNLSQLQLDNCSSLHTLYARNNSLGSLDLSGSPLLDGLNCDHNELNALDVSANTQLESLYCNDNQLSSLILDVHGELEELNCSNNLLTTLNLQSLVDLDELACANNQLNCLDLNTGAPCTLDISDNAFTAEGNPDLYCVAVYNPDWAASALAPFFDNAVEFLTDCGADCGTLSTHGTIAGIDASSARVLATHDLMGRNVDIETATSTVLIQRLENGRVRKVMYVE